MRSSIIAALAIAPFFVARGQVAPSAARGAETITAADVRRRIFVIADDSMMGRDTPSRGLELTAQYIADAFRRFGLKPAGDDGTFLQRYAISRPKLDGDSSRVTFTTAGSTVSASFNKNARFLGGPQTGKPIAGRTMLLAGKVTAQTVAGLELRDRIVLLVLSDPRALAPQAVIDALREKEAAAVILISNRDSTIFSRQVAAQFRERISLERGEPATTPVVEVHERAVRELLASADVALRPARAAAQPVSRELDGLTITATIRDLPGSPITAPNVVGILEGSDPVLKNEFVVFSAHMDHIGVSPESHADSINNGADDDGSGTAGVIELAEAFSQASVPPKRSMIFLTVSGEEKGLWGSEWFTSHPAVAIGDVVADINIDMIGRNWKDTIVAIGKEHSDLGATLDRVVRAHRELHLKAIDDIWPEENFYSRSDHFNFARRGVPILFFFNGVHADYHQVSDSPDKIDAEKESRILRLIYFLGEDVANARQRPKWNPESYRKIVTPQPQR
jgi:hypothetical protein